MAADFGDKTLRQYEILEEVGRGGMSVVYKAFQSALQRHVAIKVLPRALSFDREFVERFLREARAVAKLNHPHIVTIHDVGQADGAHFIVMEYVPGPSLADLLARQGALPWPQVKQIISEIASALDYAHAHPQGFVHRDIKPGNILLDLEGVAKLTDFGIVKAAAGTRLTQTGTLLGTPAYMSPEQARGTEITRSTDIYSLGVVAYEMLSGRVPFSGDTMAVLHAHVYDAPDLTVLPPRLQGVVGKALEKDPRNRYETAGAFSQALRRAAEGPQPKRPESVPLPSAPPEVERSSAVPAWLWGVGGAMFVLAMGAVLALALFVFQNLAGAPALTGNQMVTRTSRAAVESSTDIPTNETRAPPLEISPTSGSPEPTSSSTPGPTPSSAPSPTVRPSQSERRVVFVRGSVGNTDVCVMSRVGTEMTCLASPSCDEAEPAWSPDGTRIAYQSNCSGSYDIWVIDVRTGQRIQLTDTAGVDEREPDWSPDGSQLVYRVSAVNSDRNADGELWTMSSTGGNRRRLGDRPIPGRSPRWSPDGQKVLFMSERSGNWQIYSHDLTTDQTHRLTNCITNCRWPCWSPDGQYVAYHSTVSARGSGSATADTIWIIRASGGTPNPLTTGDSPGRPSWSLGGQIVFNSRRGIEVIGSDGTGRRVLLIGGENWAPEWSE